MHNQQLLTKENVIQLIKPYAEKIYEKIFIGFEDYLSHDLDVGHIHDKTTKANIVRSRIIHRIKELVLEYPEWKWVVRNGGIFIVIDGKIWLRFKKLSNEFLTKNNPTKQTEAFRGQQKSEKNISGRYINIDIGWLLNDFYNEIRDIYIVAPDGKRNMWRVVFKPKDAQKGALIPLFKESKEEKDSQINIAKVKPQFKKYKRKTDEADQ